MTTILQNSPTSWPKSWDSSHGRCRTRKKLLLKVARGAFHRHEMQNCQEKNLTRCKKFCAGNVPSVHNSVHCSGKNLLCKIKVDLCTVVDNFPVTVCLPTEKVDRCLHSFRNEQKNRGELAPSFLRAKKNLPIPA